MSYTFELVNNLYLLSRKLCEKIDNISVSIRFDQQYTNVITRQQLGNETLSYNECFTNDCYDFLFNNHNLIVSKIEYKFNLTKMYNILDNVINTFPYICLGRECSLKEFLSICKQHYITTTYDPEFTFASKFGVHKCKYNVVYNVFVMKEIDGVTIDIKKLPLDTRVLISN